MDDMGDLILLATETADIIISPDMWDIENHKHVHPTDTLILTQGDSGKFYVAELGRRPEAGT